MSIQTNGGDVMKTYGVIAIIPNSAEADETYTGRLLVTKDFDVFYELATDKTVKLNGTHRSLMEWQVEPIENNPTILERIKR